MQARVIVRLLRMRGDSRIWVRIREGMAKNWDGQPGTLPATLEHTLRRLGLEPGILAPGTAWAVWTRVKQSTPTIAKIA